MCAKKIKCDNIFKKFNFSCTLGICAGRDRGSKNQFSSWLWMEKIGFKFPGTLHELWDSFILWIPQVITLNSSWRFRSYNTLIVSSKPPVSFATFQVYEPWACLLFPVGVGLRLNNGTVLRPFLYVTRESPLPALSASPATRTHDPHVGSRTLQPVGYTPSANPGLILVIATQCDTPSGAFMGSHRINEGPRNGGYGFQAILSLELLRTLLNITSECKATKNLGNIDKKGLRNVHSPMVGGRGLEHGG